MVVLLLHTNTGGKAERDCRTWPQEDPDLVNELSSSSSLVNERPIGECRSRRLFGNCSDSQTIISARESKGDIFPCVLLVEAREGAMTDKNA